MQLAPTPPPPPHAATLLQPHPNTTHLVNGAHHDAPRVAGGTHSVHHDAGGAGIQARCGLICGQEGSGGGGWSEVVMGREVVAVCVKVVGGCVVGGWVGEEQHRELLAWGKAGQTVWSSGTLSHLPSHPSRL